MKILIHCELLDDCDFDAFHQKVIYFPTKTPNILQKMKLECTFCQKNNKTSRFMFKQNPRVSEDPSMALQTPMRF